MTPENIEHVKITVDTFNNGKIKKLDAKNLRKEDLKSLHERDAFMFYSIPGIRRAAMNDKAVDYSDMDVLFRDSNGAKTTITRSRRISFEADHVLSVLHELSKNSK